MDSKNDWEVLTTAWSKSLKKARAHQAIIDDKMSSYLKGTGNIPTLTALAKVESYWELHVQTRQATNRFIAQQINSKHTSSSSIAETSKSDSD